MAKKKEVAAGRGAKKTWVTPAYKLKDGSIVPAKQGMQPKDSEKAYCNESKEFLVLDDEADFGLYGKYKKVNTSVIFGEKKPKAPSKNESAPDVQEATDNGIQAQLSAAIKELEAHDKTRASIVARIQKLSAKL